MARILALDCGTRRTGIAVSDPLCIIATALTTVPTSELLLFLKEYIDNNVVSTIVIGKPIQMNGLESESWKDIEQLSVQIQAAFPCQQIAFEDERFTSKLASRAIAQSTLKKSQKRNKALIDMTSATIILQSYLEHTQ